ncbi:MAG TPA: anti-sigma factor [Candidatus Saccharimonadales bacterium]|nr:anti-sigma factor [Candidatus Saccharimonadales bacterium]
MDPHVTDDLELYALGALAEPASARIAAHLAECPACRAQAADLAGIVEALAGTLPGREPPAALRSRILASARDDTAVASPRRHVAWAVRARRAAPVLALAAAVALLLGIDVLNVSQLRAAEAERADHTATLDKVSRGGKAWYMAGLERWTGSGGTLFAPGAANTAPFVVFHDLQAAPAGSLYTLWLVDADGTWVRGANFTPNGRIVQTVELDVPVAGFERCALTLETRAQGKREGPVVMQSRLAPPAAQ